jgi:nitrate/nitrite-specific signal transduction histidine kinase
MGLLMGRREERGKGEAFPARIGRKLGFAMGLALFLVLLVGGISMFLSSSISRGTRVIKAESDEIEYVNHLHTLMHHGVEAVQNVVLSGKGDLAEDAEFMLENLHGDVVEYLAAPMAQKDTPEKTDELKIIQQIIGVTSSLSEQSARLVKTAALGQRVDLRTLDQLDKLSLSGHDLFERVNQIHHAKMKKLMQASEAKMKRIMGIYVAFAFLGVFSLILGRVIFSKTIVLPVRRLASATLDIAAGDLRKRVAVTSKDEIGQLSHSFNLMAERLEQHEGELRAVQEDLARKVRETEALYRVGMEISALLELDTILTSVIEKARELLKGEAACLCLMDAEGHLVPRASSGPFALTAPDEATAGPPFEFAPSLGNPLGDGHVGCGRHCPPIRRDHQLTHIAAPLKRGERSIGALCVIARSPRSFSSREMDLLQGLASQAAIAIENARLHKQLRSLTLLEERERIAMDLHDGIIQSIYAVGLNLEGCVELVKDDSREVRAPLDRAVDDLNDVIRGIRSYISNLRPSPCDGRGLREALADALKVLKGNSSIKVEVIEQGVYGELSREQVTQLSHIAQEALANVLKHAGASSVTVRLLSKDHRLILAIQDNGVGFDPQMVEPTAGQGLRNMAERARVLGGAFSVKNGQGSGTEISVQIPLAGGGRESRA